MITIVPTIFAKSKEQFDKRFAKLLPLTQEFQIDFMDGELVKETSITLEDIPNLPKEKSFEAHLMVARPEEWIEEVAQKGFTTLLFHIESQKGRTTQETKELIETIHNAKLQVGIVLEPQTDVSAIAPFIQGIDCVMFMGHCIGVEGIAVEEEVYAKIAQCKEHFPNTIIEVDGGVDNITAQKFLQAGATRLSVGSYISSAQEPKKALEELQKIGEKYSGSQTT